MNVVSDSYEVPWKYNLMNVVCVYLNIFPFSVKQILISWQSSSYECQPLQHQVSPLSSQIRSDNACWLWGAVRGSVWTHFSLFAPYEPWLHRNIQSTTQQLFVWRYLSPALRTGELTEAQKTMTWRECVWGTPYTWMICWYCIRPRAVEQIKITIAHYITIYSTYTCINNTYTLK